MKQLVQKYLPVAGGGELPWQHDNPEGTKLPF